MAKRKQSEIVNIKLRLREPLRAKVEKAAKSRGVSMNAEMVARLEDTFANQSVVDQALDAVLGGPDFRPILFALVTQFNFAVSNYAKHNGLGGAPADWLDNPHCYLRGIAAVVQTLIDFRPEQEFGEFQMGLENAVLNIKDRHGNLVFQKEAQQ
jgi:hypothetical protein